MKLKIKLLTLAVSVLCVTQQAAASNPASTQYVQYYVQDYVQNLPIINALATRVGTSVPGGGLWPLPIAPKCME